MHLDDLLGPSVAAPKPELRPILHDPELRDRGGHHRGDALGGGGGTGGSGSGASRSTRRSVDKSVRYTAKYSIFNKRGETTI